MWALGEYRNRGAIFLSNDTKQDSSQNKVVFRKTAAASGEDRRSAWHTQMGQMTIDVQTWRAHYPKEKPITRIQPGLSHQVPSL